MSDRNSKLLARFQKCLDEEAKDDARDQEQEARISKTVFWSEMRDIIAVNALSSGLDILDDVAKALIDDTGRAAQALSGPVTILPHPSMQSASTGATPHPSFTSPSKKRSVPAKQAKGSASKKQKASVSPNNTKYRPDPDEEAEAELADEEAKAEAAQQEGEEEEEESEVEDEVTIL
ncbi:hypothetical protein PF010_g27889 [Phytophthora fragariae]|uniref:Uncharacterized protein n=1 Tax=Phytophthora fragariae TaxID=53985 RepID=A0A6G0JSJ9_9STRA|nr:hypothetical protein PF010_g27889 [Phytophthora fragariae]